MASGITTCRGFSSRLSSSVILSDQTSKNFPQICTSHGRSRAASLRMNRRRVLVAPARAMAMAATQEAFVPSSREENREHLEHSYQALPPAAAARRNLADDLSLNNPLLRQQRMGCGWLGVILEWEGVIVEEDLSLERKAWMALAEEEGKSLPPAFVLKRAAGMKNEQAISEVLCWSRDFQQNKRMAKRKEELYQHMQRGTYRLVLESRDFVQTLRRYNIPLSVASTRPRKFVKRAIEAVGMEGMFNQVVAAEDVHRGKPDPEMFLYAAERLGFIPERCIVFGSSNSSVEAAHDARMKCVAVAGSHPVFELGAADLVVRKLTELSMVDLKNLADLDSPEFQPVPEMEESVERNEEEEDDDEYRGNRDAAPQTFSFLDDL